MREKERGKKPKNKKTGTRLESIWPRKKNPHFSKGIFIHSIWIGSLDSLSLFYLTIMPNPVLIYLKAETSHAHSDIYPHITPRFFLFFYFITFFKKKWWNRRPHARKHTHTNLGHINPKGASLNTILLLFSPTSPRGKKKKKKFCHFF